MTECLTAPVGPKMELAPAPPSPPFVGVFSQSGSSMQDSPASPQASSDSAERNSSFNSVSVSNVTEDMFHLSDEEDENRLLQAITENTQDNLLGGCLEKKESESNEGVCGICQETYSQPPRVLNCLHVFCESCLQKQQRPTNSSPALGSNLSVIQSNSIICCPACEDETECSLGIKGLPLDYVLMNRLDAVAIKKRTVICNSCKSEDHAIARCQDCSSFLCACCEKAHSSMLCFENHEVVSFEVFDEDKAEIHRAIHCVRHPKELVQLYDPTCGTALCNYCLVSGHQGHGCKETSEFEEPARSEFKQVINECRMSFEKFDDLENKLSNVLHELELTRDSARSAIEETFQTFKAILEKAKNAALKQLANKHSVLETKVMDDMQRCSETRVSLEDAIEFSEKLSKYGNATEFLALKLLAGSRMKKLVNSCLEKAKVRDLKFITNEEKFESSIASLFGEVIAIDETADGDSLRNNPLPSRLQDEASSKRKDLSLMKGSSLLPATSQLINNPLLRCSTADDHEASGLRKYENLLSSNDLIGLHDPIQSSNPLRRNDLVIGNDLLRGRDLMRENSDVLRNSSERNTDFNTLLNTSIPPEISNTSAARLLPSELVDAVNSSSISSSHFGRMNAHSLISSPPLPSVASLPSLGQTMRAEDSQLSELRSAMAQINLARLASVANAPDSDLDTDVLPMLVGNNVRPPSRLIGSPDLPCHLVKQQTSSAALSQLDDNHLMMNLSALASLSGPRSLGSIGQSSSPPLPLSSSSSGGHRSPPQATVTILPPPTGPQVNPMPTRNRMTPMHIRSKFGQLGSGNVQFSSPHGFCLSPNEEIVVADTNNHRIQIFDKTGEFKSEFGGQGKEEGQLWYPRKVAVMKNTGTYVVCDRGNERSRMQLFTRNGEFLKKIAIRYIDIVAGLALTSDGRIVAVDSVSPTVFVISEAGDLLLWFDCSEHMREPSDIAVWGSEFYICDFKGHCVVVYSESGNFLRRIGGEGLTNFPNGIDISDHGDILVGDSHGNRFHIVVFNREGQAVSEFECPYCKVSRCCGLKITSEGYVVTLAKNNHHVLILNTLYIN